MRRMISVLILSLMLSANADDRVFAPAVGPSLSVDSNMDAMPPSREDATKALAAAAMNHPTVAAELARVARCKAAADAAVRESCKQSLEFRVGIPDGAGVAVTYTPVLPLTVGMSVGTTGATVSVNAEATFNVLWKSNLTPVVTVKLSNIVFTGLTDNIANGFVSQIYGDQVTVRMSGKWVHAGSAMAGLDWVTNSGFHLFFKGGIVGQLGESHGGDNSAGEIKLKGWWGPAAELGIGGNFSWF